MNLSALKLCVLNSCKNNSLVSRTFKTGSICNGYALDWSPNAKLNKTILDKYMCLPIPECKCQLDYIWIDGSGEHVRSKSRTLDYIPTCYQEIPKWMYDGSSTGQAKSANSDLFLVPVAMYKDPFRRGNSKLVLCETYDPDHKPTSTNNRFCCAEVSAKVCKHEPLFGIEQEFFFKDQDGRPYGWPVMKGDPKGNRAYCGVGANKVYCRDIVEAHYRCCLYAGIDISGTNAEVAPSQWEFQIGAVDSVKTADDVWTARYILYRVAEEFGITVSLKPKLLANWNGSGCHTNFSTKEMRAENGLAAIDEAICRLSKRQKEHIKQYDPCAGLQNALRLTGAHETSYINTFTMGTADRNVSVRIPRDVKEKKKGYLEDRRPAANCDPYLVITAILKTCLLDDH